TGSSAFTRTPNFATSQSGRVTVQVARSSPAAVRPSSGAIVAKPRSRLRGFVVGLVLVLSFAGLLAATGAYVRSWINQRRAQQTATTTIVGREALTTTDLNLREGPDPSSDLIGLAEGGSQIGRASW